MSNSDVPLQAAQNPAPQPDEDLLAMLGLHPAQMQVAQGLASGAIHPQEVLDATTPKPPLQAAQNPEPIAPGEAPKAPEASAAPIAPAPSLSGIPSTPRIAPALPPDVQAPTRLTEDQAKLQHDTSTGSGIEQFQQRHPILGGIARVGAGIGSAVFPTIAAGIPGTDMHHQVVLNQDRRAVGEDLGEAKSQADTQELQARTNLANEQAKVAANPKVGTTPEAETLHDLMTGNNGQPRVNPSTGKPYSYLEAYQSVYQAKQDTKPDPAATQQQNKQQYQAIVGKLDTARLPTDPKSIAKSADAALKRGVITPEEHATLRSYEAANQTPGTNLTVHVAGQEEGNRLATEKMFEGSDVLAHMPDGSRQIMSYADAKAQGLAPERLVKLSAKESQEERDKIASVQSGFQGLDRYRSEFKNSAPKLTDQDRDAMRVLTTHAQNGDMGGLLAGMFDQIPLVGPLNKYANALLEGTMTSDQYKQLSPAGKKLVSDYFTSVVDNFASMKARLGSVGRNPAMIQAETNTIPLPYLDWDSANVAFENKRATMAGNAQSMPSIYQAPSAK